MSVDHICMVSLWTVYYAIDLCVGSCISIWWFGQGRKESKPWKQGTIQNISVVQARNDDVSTHVVAAKLKIIDQILEIWRRKRAYEICLKMQYRVWMNVRVKERSQEFKPKYRRTLFPFSKTGNTRGEAGLKWIKRHVQSRAR